MAGNSVELDALYPIAIFPSLSTARLGIQRATVESGAQVDCCSGPEVTTVPPVTLSWYHRGEVNVVFPGLATVCVIQSDSTLPRFVYWFCTINRSRNVSSAFPLFAGTDVGATPQLASVTLEGPVSVELAVLFQSTWNFQMRASLADQITEMKFGRPTGGAPVAA